MSNWYQRFKNHQMHKQVQECVAALEGLDTQKLSQVDLEAYARLLKVLKFVKARFDSADPDLVGDQLLNNLTGPISRT